MNTSSPKKYETLRVVTQASDFIKQNKVGISINNVKYLNNHLFDSIVHLTGCDFDGWVDLIDCARFNGPIMKLITDGLNNEALYDSIPQEMRLAGMSPEEWSKVQIFLANKREISRSFQEKRTRAAEKYRQTLEELEQQFENEVMLAARTEMLKAYHNYTRIGVKDLHPKVIREIGVMKLSGEYDVESINKVRDKAIADLRERLMGKFPNYSKTASYQMPTLADIIKCRKAQYDTQVVQEELQQIREAD